MRHCGHLSKLLGPIILLGTLGCENNSTGPAEAEPPTLKSKYANYFSVGAAVDSRSYQTHEGLLVEHFSSLTTENEMKFDSLQPAEGRFNYTVPDRVAAFAEANGMKMRGHALVWHRQNPAWLFQDDQGEPVAADVLRERMRSHISNVVEHFKGEVSAWDVVNEAIMNDGELRTGEEEEDDQKSPWFAILGESYIADAFRFASEADPDALLFYNDYYNYLPARREAIYELLKGLLDDGVPVHGVGLQCHLNIEPSDNPEHPSYYQTVSNLEEAIELYSSLGLQVQITELDVSVYVAGNTYEKEDFYTEETFTEDVQARQAERYRALFEMFREHADVITTVSFWGVADDNTWLSEFSSGRTDFPLLFDTHHEPKPAYDAVMDF